jgi:hypothetical protein
MPRDEYLDAQLDLLRDLAKCPEEGIALDNRGKIDPARTAIGWLEDMGLIVHTKGANLGTHWAKSRIYITGAGLHALKLIRTAEKTAAHQAHINLRRLAENTHDQLTQKDETE